MHRSDESIAVELADRYCLERASGRVVPLAGLCSDHPHLEPLVAEIVQVQADVERLRDIIHDENEPMPAQIGRFPIEEVIGRGGMNVVFRGRDEELQRPLAVKLLQKRFLGFERIYRRFLVEARITAQLQHPVIPAIHQIGTHHDGRPFLAMKLVVGRNLDQLLKDEVAHWNRLAVFETICQGLAYAHQHGVIHRDLKPQNVMVGDHGEVQVMDWGLSKRMGDNDEPMVSYSALNAASLKDDSRTAAGSVIGTPAYMAPEQARGEIEKLDRRTDVFGLGGILCAMLTGKPPYVGESNKTTLKMANEGDLSGTVRRLQASGYDPELVNLCLEMLHPNQSARPSDAIAVARIITNYRVCWTIKSFTRHVLDLTYGPGQ